MLVILTALFVVALAAPVIFRWTGRQGFYPVSYTHLTLPTIYSV